MSTVEGVERINVILIVLATIRIGSLASQFAKTGGQAERLTAKKQHLNHRNDWDKSYAKIG